jgi:hypothetical protein
MSSISDQVSLIQQYMHLVLSCRNGTMALLLGAHSSFAARSTNVKSLPQIVMGSLMCHVTRWRTSWAPTAHR